MSDMRIVKINDLKHFEGTQALRPVPKPTDKKWPDFVRDYCDSIEQVGLLNWGFTCVQREDGLYVTDGNRRITAIKYNLGQNRPRTMELFPNGEINVKVITADEHTVLLMQAVGNLKLEKATPKQIMTVILQMMNAGMTLEVVGQNLSLSEASVEKYLKLNTLPEDVVEMVGKEEGKISIANAVTLTTLPRDVLDPKNEEEMASWVQKASGMKADEFAAEAAKEIKAAREARKGENKGKKTQFSPEAKLRSKDELAIMYAEAEAAFTRNPESVEARVRFETLKEVFSLDEQTQARLKEEFETSLKAAQNKTALKKKEKEFDAALTGIDDLLKLGVISEEEAKVKREEIVAKKAALSNVAAVQA